MRQTRNTYQNGWIETRPSKKQGLVFVLVGAVGIEPTNYMETKEFCGAPRPSKSFKGTQWNP
jgi:hypothetical protein